MWYYKVNSAESQLGSSCPATGKETGIFTTGCWFQEPTIVIQDEAKHGKFLCKLIILGWVNTVMNNF